MIVRPYNGGPLTTTSLHVAMYQAETLPDEFVPCPVPPARLLVPVIKTGDEIRFEREYRELAVMKDCDSTFQAEWRNDATLPATYDPVFTDMEMDLEGLERAMEEGEADSPDKLRYFCLLSIENAMMNRVQFAIQQKAYATKLCHYIKKQQHKKILMIYVDEDLNAILSLLQVWGTQTAADLANDVQESLAL